MAGVRYEYIGTKKYFADRHAGTGMVWRGTGDIQEIDAAFVPTFERIYVDCVPLAGAQMRRVSSEADAKKAKVDKTKVPAGTPYSNYSYTDLKRLYAEKVGKAAHPEQTAVALIDAIQQADLGAAALGEDVEL